MKLGQIYWFLYKKMRVVPVAHFSVKTLGFKPGP